MGIIDDYSFCQNVLLHYALSVYIQIDPLFLVSTMILLLMFVSWFADFEVEHDTCGLHNGVDT